MHVYVLLSMHITMVMLITAYEGQGWLNKVDGIIQRQCVSSYISLTDTFTPCHTSDSAHHKVVLD